MGADSFAAMLPRMDGPFDVIVIGVGAMGAATCLALADHGARVLGLDRFSVPNDRGSSHGRSRIFRVGYYEHPDYVPLLQRARRAWLDLEARAGESLFLPVGGLWLGPPECTLIRGTREAAERHGLPHEVLTAAEVRRRFPMFNVEDGFIGFLESNAGVIRPERAIASFARLAREGGATLREHVTVLDWRSDSRGVTVWTDQGEYRGDRLVICAGPWAPKLLRGVAVSLTVSRQPTAWFTPLDPAPFNPARFPCWAYALPDDSFFYGFGLIDAGHGVKIARHHRGRVANPDALDRVVSTAEMKSLHEGLASILPAAAGPMLDSSVCMYTNSPDGHFVLDVHPEHSNVSFAAGFSGHGFKFAPVIGEAMADLALRGGTDLPIGFLRAARFGRSAVE